MDVRTPLHQRKDKIITRAQDKPWDRCGSAAFSTSIGGKHPCGIGSPELTLMAWCPGGIRGLGTGKVNRRQSGGEGLAFSFATLQLPTLLLQKGSVGHQEPASAMGSEPGGPGGCTGVTAPSSAVLCRVTAGSSAGRRLSWFLTDTDYTSSAPST